jgi:hypothetical protein
LAQTDEPVIASGAKQSLPRTEIASSPVAPRNDIPRVQEMVSLLAALLSLPHPQDCPALTPSPQKQKEKTHEALVAWLCAAAKQQAVTYAWEDLHWADPSTLGVFTLLLDQVATTRLLMVLTFRPEFMPPWRPRSQGTRTTYHATRTSGHAPRRMPQTQRSSQAVVRSLQLVYRRV